MLKGICVILTLEAASAEPQRLKLASTAIAKALHFFNFIIIITLQKIKLPLLTNFNGGARYY